MTWKQNNKKTNIKKLKINNRHTQNIKNERTGTIRKRIIVEHPKYYMDNIIPKIFSFNKMKTSLYIYQIFCKHRNTIIQCIIFSVQKVQNII